MSTERVSLADVARRAGVQRPAASNWKRRHSDFPHPLAGTGGELYDPTEIAAWLDARRIPVNALRSGEKPGTTFGDRFRETAAGTRVVPTRREPTVMSGPSPAEELMRILAGVRDFADPADYAETLLALLCFLAVDPDGFARFREAVRDAPLPAAGELFLRAWDGMSRRSTVRLDDPPVPRGADGGRVLVAIAEVLAGLRPGAGGGSRRVSPEAASLYERLLDQVADMEGHRGGEFHTPRSVVRTMVEMVTPAAGERIHDPCCGTGGMLVGVIEHVRTAALASAPPTEVTGASLTERGRRLAVMNLLVHGVPADIRAGALEEVRGWSGRGERFDVVVTNPPFTMTLGDRTPLGHGWPYGDPPSRSANFAWLQSVLATLSDHGRAAVVTANGATFSRQRAEQAIRAAMVEDGVVDCVVALPSALFRSTAIPVSLWILRKGRTADEGVLLIDAGGLGGMRSRIVRTLGDDDVCRISETYRRWRQHRFDDEPGFARRVLLDELRAQGHSLSPPTYVASVPVQADVLSTRGEVDRLRHELTHLHARSAEIDTAIEWWLGGER
ncbi:hypothetical protein E1293_35180 [Actinomadura darangshiensis]|uniref:DNA methylase adenine-specific domain-containing protein n=1 Tax=Actinomadura darangshiensis TaxID=705336 RepID=A0A4R5AIN6_9ACTN|nr:N-6 DNA methylase [Actinomadura darangshiensis]TDD69992.1 hypothetical protein E1293_35180 [Actinomadura darangshiensis]